MPRKSRPLSDEELLAAVDAAESAALGASASTIATDRADAIDRYLGKPYPNDSSLASQPGRSSINSRDVADVVQGVLANTIKPFVGGEEIVRFDPLGPDDEDRAQQETDYVNWVLMSRNNGFLTLNAVMHDALLVRVGYVKMGWTKRTDIVIESYEALADDELGLISKDKDVEIVQHSGYPDPNAAPSGSTSGAAPMLHDLKVRRIRPTEYVETLPTPPEEILVSQRARTPALQEADFVQHRTHKTLSELRQLGYDVDDDITDDDNAETMEDIARERAASGGIWNDDRYDRARRLVLFKETWMRIDRDGDGIAELRRICQVGKTLLADEEADIVPIAAFCYSLMPHQHQGVSVYDQVKDVAEQKTALFRAFLDNKYLANNGRTVANENVNYDDLLTSRPGGVVRTIGTGPVGNDVLPLVTPDTGPSALQGLEYLDAVRENRTGYTRQTQGLSSDTLSTETLGGQILQLTQSQLRLEMSARTIAETGMREMCKIVHALTLKHSTRAEKVRLRNKWVEIDPREWVRRTDLSISVGIGSASQQTLIQGLTLIGQTQEKVLALGLTDADKIYNTCKKLTNAIGFKNAEEFYTPPQIDPQTGKPQPIPPQPSPQEKVEQIRQQGDAQKTQALHAQQAQKDQFEADLRMRELDHSAQLKQQEQQGALQLQQSNDQRQSALDKQKHELEMAKLDREERMEKYKVDVGAATTLAAARISAGIDPESQLLNKIEQEAGFGQLEQLVSILSAPKEIVRGPDGKASGLKRSMPPQQQTVQ